VIGNCGELVEALPTSPRRAFGYVGQIAALLGFALYFVLFDFVLFEPFRGYSGFPAGGLASKAALHGLRPFTSEPLRLCVRFSVVSAAPV
jgi:hypothetical protein